MHLTIKSFARVVSLPLPFCRRLRNLVTYGAYGAHAVCTARTALSRMRNIGAHAAWLGVVLTLLLPGLAWANTSTGFAITKDGHIATVAHGLKDLKAATIAVTTPSGERFNARLLAFSKKMDLAILKIDASTQAVTFASDKDLPLGLEVVVLGYPLPQITGNNLKVTNGLITSTTGLKGNKNTFQLSAEVQSGSSGSPVFSPDGLVIGMVLGKLNPRIKEDSARLNIPQNMNFASKAFLIQKVAASLGLLIDETPLKEDVFQRPAALTKSQGMKVFQVHIPQAKKTDPPASK